MKYKHLIAFIIAVAMLPPGVKSQQRVYDPVEAALHSISSHDLMAWVEEQCRDEYTGRLTGTPGYDACAEWLASMFAGWGIEPAGDNGTFFQWFDIPHTTIGEDCGVALHLPLEHGGEVMKEYRYVSEYMPGSTSANGEITAEVVYAGYGITAPELRYDDYKGVDVEGKIILIEPEAPVPTSAGPEKFNPWFEHSFHQTKLKNAVAHGAAGMIYNYGPIANPNNAYDPGFIYVHIGDAMTRDVFEGTGKTHSEVVQKIRSTLRPQSFATGKTVSIRMETQHHPDGRGASVIGLLKGSDPELSKEVIIVGGHLDHMGKCYEIIQGANDNASAVAVMMGIAKALTEYDIELKRSVLFLAFGSEEQGIVGAREYLDNPVFPLEKSVLINMDGVGVGHSITAIAGKDYPLLFEAVAQANEKYIHRNLRATTFPNLGRPRLDAARFLRAGIPSLSFSTWGSESYYHVPLDNTSFIKPEIMEDLAQMLLVAITDLANREESLR